MVGSSLGNSESYSGFNSRKYLKEHHDHLQKKINYIRSKDNPQNSMRLLVQN
jgi:hypothetical protein